MPKFIQNQEYLSLVGDISRIYEEAKDSTLIAVNKIRNQAYWLIGQRIVEEEQKGQVRAQYGTHLISRLAEDLGQKHANGFSESSLRAMRKFYLSHPTKPKSALSWSHYQLLLSVKNEKERQVLEKKAVKESWSKRKLKSILKEHSCDVSAKTAQIVEKEKSKIIFPVVHGQLYSYKVIKKESLRLDCGFHVSRSLGLYGGGGIYENGDVLNSYMSNYGTFKFSKSKLGSKSCYTYKAVCRDIIGAHHLRVSLDLGFGLTIDQTIRLRHLSPINHQTAKAQKIVSFLERIMKRCAFLIIKTYREEEAYSADIFFLPYEKDPSVVARFGRHLNQELIYAGLAECNSRPR